MNLKICPTFATVRYFLAAFRVGGNAECFVGSNGLWLLFCRIYLQKWDAFARIGLKLIWRGLKPSLQTRIHIVSSQKFFPNLKS